MAVYLITYERFDPKGPQGDRLLNRLHELGAVRIHKSQWICSGDAGQAGMIYDQIAPFVPGRTGLLVEEISR